MTPAPRSRIIKTSIPDDAISEAQIQGWLPPSELSAVKHIAHHRKSTISTPIPLELLEKHAHSPLDKLHINHSLHSQHRCKAGSGELWAK